MPMMSWTTPARRSSTPACDRQCVLVACGVFLLYSYSGCSTLTHRHELAATLFDALRGAAQEDARGDAGEDPADRADDAGDASDDAGHREDGEEDTAGDDEALGLVGLAGQVGVVGAHAWTGQVRIHRPHILPVHRSWWRLLSQPCSDCAFSVSPAIGRVLS